MEEDLKKMSQAAREEFLAQEAEKTKYRDFMRAPREVQDQELKRIENHLGIRGDVYVAGTKWGPVPEEQNVIWETTARSETTELDAELISNRNNALQEKEVLKQAQLEAEQAEERVRTLEDQISDLTNSWTYIY